MVSLGGTEATLAFDLCYIYMRQQKNPCTAGREQDVASRPPGAVWRHLCEGHATLGEPCCS